MLQEKKPTEDAGQFANRVQHLVAYHMGVEATKYSKKDALSYRLSLLNKQHNNWNYTIVYGKKKINVNHAKLSFENFGFVSERIQHVSK